MNRPIYIIGSGGMLGNELSRIFDTNVRTLTRMELDVTDKEAVSRILAGEPKIIINASGYTDVNAAEANKDLAMQVNGKAVGYLAEAARQSGSVLVHISTDYVFDGKDADGYTEDALPENPLNVYGVSKLAGEEALRSVAPDYYLIRTSWIFGRDTGSFPHTMLRLAHERDMLKVVNNQHGKPTYVVDLACAIKDMADKIDTPDQHSFGTYHITNEDITTWYDYALEIFRLSGMDSKINVTAVPSSEFPSPAKRPQYSVLINTKFPPLRSWQEALAEYLDLMPKDYLIDTTG